MFVVHHFTASWMEFSKYVQIGLIKDFHNYLQTVTKIESNAEAKKLSTNNRDKILGN